MHTHVCTRCAEQMMKELHEPQPLSPGQAQCFLSPQDTKLSPLGLSLFRHLCNLRTQTLDMGW
jgi:hypothetical protein